MGHRLRTLTMSMEAFGRMEWPLAMWGLSANISEKTGARNKLRRIIQTAGGRAAVHKQVYCHTGWRKVNNRLCFLHGGGAIGGDDVDVQLDYGFSRYCLDGIRDGDLVDATDAEKRAASMMTALAAMDIVPKSIGVPLTGFHFLVPLKYFLEQKGHRPSFLPFVRGATQTGKSSYTSLLMNYWGYDFSFESSMPANFENTANSLSLKLFQLKDMPLMVDDYHPQTEPQKAKAMANVAESLARMIGDGAVRDRMKADGSAQNARPVRALCVATGEETPRISPSGVARLYVVDIKQGDVPLQRKGSSEEQKQREVRFLELCTDARNGLLNECMKGYINWLLEHEATLGE